MNKKLGQIETPVFMTETAWSSQLHVNQSLKSTLNLKQIYIPLFCTIYMKTLLTKTVREIKTVFHQMQRELEWYLVERIPLPG